MLLGKKRMLIELCNSGLPQTSNVWKMQYLQMRYVCVINSEHFSPQICLCRDQVQGFARPIEHCFCPWSLWSLFHEADRIVLLNFESAQALLAQNPPVTFHHICVLCVLFETLWTVARQSPLSMWFSGQEYWSGSRSRNRTCIPYVSWTGRRLLYHYRHPV